MFISRLTLQNWRSHKASEFEFGTVNFIRGPNAAGKTSVGQALEFLLTGRCLGTDEAGRGGDALIRVGPREARIEGLVRNSASQDAVNAALVVARTRSQAGSNCTVKANGRVYAGRQVEEFLEKQGWSRAALSCVLRAGRFLELPVNEQKEFLAEVLDPEPLAIPQEISEAIGACFNDFGGKQIDLEGLRNLEKRATTLRAECTAALREIGEPQPPSEANKGKANPTQIRAKLDELRSEQGALIRKKEKLENDWAAQSRRRRELPKEIERLKAQILSEPEEKHLLGLMDKQTEVRGAEASIVSLETTIRELDRRILQYEASPGICPTCKQAVDVSKQLEELTQERGTAQEKLKTARAFVHTYGGQEDAREKLRLHRAAGLDVQKLEKELSKLPEDKAPETAKLIEQIDKLEERIQNGQKVLTDAAGAEEAQRAYQDALRQRQSLGARRAAADTLAKWAGQNGAQSQMTAGKLPKFTKQINDVLEAFGYVSEIELEPYCISARRLHGDANLQPDSLSESEKWRFSLAFQAALAKATRINAVVLDRADILVGANRGALISTILALGLDQVFLLASVDKRVPMPPAFTVFDLSLNEKGETTVNGQNKGQQAA